MGGHESKKRKYVDGLTQAQKTNICKMFNARGRNIGPITSDMLHNIWRDHFSDGLITTILQYLFKSVKQLEIEDLEEFYYIMVEGRVAERAVLLMKILGIDNSIPPRSFQMYIVNLIESFLIVLRRRNSEAFSTWKSGDLVEKSDMAVVAKYFTNDINYTDGKIDLAELQRWLGSCGFVAGILESVMKCAFNMEVPNLLPLLPMATKNSTLLRVPTALALSHLTKPYTNRVWRLLYSSSTDAHSWSVVEKSMLAQGPTIILIQDTAGPLFGGFASQSWRISPKFYGDSRSFLFRLRPQMVVCTPTGYNDNFQYMNDGMATMPNGLGMGGQLNYFGFFLSSEFGPGSVSKTCTTYRDYVPLASQNDFIFSRLEIWGVGDLESAKDVERPRQKEHVRIQEYVKEKDKPKQGELVMARDPGAAALLEMVGKSGYSKNVEAS